MPKTINVSINEWAVVDRDAGAELMTTDMIDCVAIAIRTEDRIGLTHIFDKAGDREKFPAYVPGLDQFIGALGDKSQIREVHIVRNRLGADEEPDNALARVLARHLIDRGLVEAGAIRMHEDSGCTISPKRFYLSEHDNPKIYRSAFANTELEGFSPEDTENIKPRLMIGKFENTGCDAHPAEIAPLRSTQGEPFRHKKSARSDGEPFERRPTERPFSTEPQAREVDLERPEPANNPKKRARAALEDSHAKDGGLRTNFDGTHSESGEKIADPDLPSAKKSKSQTAHAREADTSLGDPMLEDIRRRLQGLPKWHQFSGDIDAGTQAVYAFAKKQGIDSLTSLLLAPRGNEAIMIEGLNAKGETVVPQDALRWREVSAPTQPSPSSDAPQPGRRHQQL